MDNGENKSSGNTRLPDELITELRKAQAVYHLRGEKAPTFGQLLFDAWKVSKSEQVKESSQKAIDSTVEHTLHLTREILSEIQQAKRTVVTALETLEGHVVRRGQSASSGEPGESAPRRADAIEQAIQEAEETGKRARELAERARGLGERNVRLAREHGSPKKRKAGRTKPHEDTGT